MSEGKLVREGVRGGASEAVKGWYGRGTGEDGGGGRHDPSILAVGRRARGRQAHMDGEATVAHGPSAEGSSGPALRREGWRLRWTVQRL